MALGACATVAAGDKTFGACVEAGAGDMTLGDCRPREAKNRNDAANPKDAASLREQETEL